MIFIVAYWINRHEVVDLKGMHYAANMPKWNVFSIVVS